MWPRSRETSRALRIHACRVTKWSDVSMPPVRTLHAGRSGSGLVSASSAVKTASVSPAGAVTSCNASIRAVALIPERLTSVEAAPLLCAGVTTYNSLRNAGLRAGDLVAIQGIGGLGHL